MEGSLLFLYILNVCYAIRSISLQCVQLNGIMESMINRIVVYCWIFGIVQAAHSQIFDGSTLYNAAKKAAALKNSAAVKEMPASESDVSVDPAQYYIGPGDKFKISVVGLPSAQYIGKVDHDGVLYVPELGIANIGRLTLVQARDSLERFVKSKLSRKNEIYVALIKLKKATVTVSGAISSPGTYHVSGNSRLLDIIKKANGGSIPSYSDFNYRRIHCSNQDSSWTCDLFPALFSDSLGENPYLFPGDHIVFNMATRRVFLTGAFKSPFSGMVPIKENESAARLISLVTLEQSADLERFVIYDASRRQTNTYKLEELDECVLEDQDIITITRKGEHGAKTVSITGEIAYPGMYPIIEGSTTVQEILLFGGEYTERADTNGAYLLRNTQLGKLSSSQYVLPALPVASSATVRPQVGASIQQLLLTGDYSVIDIEINDTIHVKHGDQIVIPEKKKHIYISGYVQNPGAVSYEANKNASYYIKRSGGLSAKADRLNIYIIRRFNERLQFRGSETLEAGDIIVVPEKEQFRKWNMFRDFIATTSAILSIAVVIISLAP